jgi:ADP-heptose:LPS heptosyltransferase
MRLLLARFQSFGDVLFTLPVIDALPEVDLLTSEAFAADVRRGAGVRNVYGLDTATGEVDDAVLTTRYDVLVDLHMRAVALPAAAENVLRRVTAEHRVGFDGPFAGPYRTLVPPRTRDEHAVECYARAVQPWLTGPLGRGLVTIDPADRRRARDVVPPQAVAVAPGARFGWKRWPAWSYANLVDRLAEAGIPAVVIGHPFDEDVVLDVVGQSRAGVRHVLGDTTFLAAVLAECGTAVVNNSGLCALAGAAGARVVCVHSHTLPAMWRPWGDGHADIVGRPGPCGCVGPEPHDLATPCGKSIPVTEVLAAVTSRTREAST